MKIEEHVPAAKKMLDLTVGEQSTTIERELEGFITEPVHITDPLAWWKVNHTRFPNIVQVAMRYLCIPATEVPSERSFLQPVARSQNGEPLRTQILSISSLLFTRIMYLLSAFP